MQAHRSYDFWIVRLGQGATDRQCLLRSCSGRIRRSISTRGRAITNDLRLSMARAIVGNRAARGSDQVTDVRSVIAPDDRSYDQSWRPASRRIILEYEGALYQVEVKTDCTINRDGRRSMVRSTVASCDRSYEHSWHPAGDRSYEHSWHPVTDRTINCGTGLPIVRSIVGAIIDRTINRSIVRPMVATYDQSYDQ